MSTRILVADDSLFWREELKLILEEDSDWTVFEAANGFDALQKSNWIQPHLVILDLSMPELDGLSAARELKRRVPELPVVIITVDKTEFLEVLARQAGVVAVFSKMECFCLKDFAYHLLETEDDVSSIPEAKDERPHSSRVSRTRSHRRPAYQSPNNHRMS